MKEHWKYFKHLITINLILMKGHGKNINKELFDN